MDEVKLGEVLDFLRLLWAVDHALQSKSKRMNRRLGATGPQRIVVRIVGKFPGISAKELASILHLHKSTLTGILERLEKRGLLTRKISTSDARRSHFTLTARGRKLDEVRAGTVEAAARRALADVSEREQSVAAGVLEKVIAELEKD